MEKKNQVLMSVLGVFALVIVTVGVSYAFFSYTRTGTTTSTINTTTGEISFVYTEDEDGVKLTNAVPMTTTAGKGLVDTYDFSVAANMTTDATISYTVTAVNVTEAGEGQKVLNNNQVRAYLTDGEGNAIWTEGDGTKLMSDIIANGETTGVLTTSSLTTTVAAPTTSAIYKLRLWLDDSVTGGNIIASDTDGDGVITSGEGYTTDGIKVTSTSTNGVYSIKVKVVATAVSNQQ